MDDVIESVLSEYERRAEKEDVVIAELYGRQQMLQRRYFPPRLRAYLGKQ